MILVCKVVDQLNYFVLFFQTEIKFKYQICFKYIFTKFGKFLSQIYVYIVYIQRVYIYNYVQRLNQRFYKSNNIYRTRLNLYKLEIRMNNL